MESWKLSTRTRNKRRMLSLTTFSICAAEASTSLTTFIQHYTGLKRLSSSSILEVLAKKFRQKKKKKEKKEKALVSKKEEAKLSLIANDMKLYIENTKNNHQKRTMNSINSHDTKSIYRNLWHFYTLTTSNQKEKLRKQSHL